MCDEKLGDKIYDLRMSKKLSQEYVARVAGVTRQTVSKWEANAAQPKSENLRLLCKALNVETSYLMPINYSETNDTDTNESPESEAVCDEVAAAESTEVVADKAEELSIPEKPKQKKHNLSKRAKIIISSVVLAIMALVGIIMIVVPIFSKMPDIVNTEIVDEGKSTVWNFSIENIGWIVFSIALSLAIILGIVFVSNMLKNKKNLKEKMAECHIN